jgi:hypothetical protein
MAYVNTGISTASTIIEKVGAEVATAVDMRGKAVKYDTSGNVVLASTAGESVMGIALLTIDEEVKAGSEIDIQIRDNGYAVVGAAVKKGDPLAVDTNGKLVKATDGQFVIATALEAAASEGIIIRVAITKYTI